MTKANETRRYILAEALKMATQKSLNEVTIGKLASASGMSKSGLFAHFNSKENLQVAVIKFASELFNERVVRSVDEALSPLVRLKTLATNWLNWYEGCARSCIFVSAMVEFEDQPGPVRGATHRQMQRWLKFLEKATDTVIESGEFKPGSDSTQFVFELYSLHLGSQKYFWLGKEDNQRLRFHTGLQSLISKYSI